MFLYVLNVKNGKKFQMAVFEYYQLGLSAPSPDTKDFSGKVLWKLKSFHQNEVMYSVGNSFAYFSYKKSRWHTFLRKKGV